MYNNYILVLITTTSFFTLSHTDRVPTQIQIYRYDLNLIFTNDSFNEPPYEYEGRLLITLIPSMNYPSDIQLYAAKDFITIQSAFIEVNTNRSGINSFDIGDDDVLTLSDTKNASTSVYYSYLFINYTSRLSIDDMYGLYRTSYTLNGKTKYEVASQLAPTFARRVLPCLDEPFFKTDWRLNVTHPSVVQVFFNTPVNVSEVDNGLETSYFRPTGTMAPYMAEITFGSFDDISCTVGENFTYGSIYYYRVCSRPETQQFRQWAVDIGPTIMDLIYNITNYSYGVIMGFQKMDLIALPGLVTRASENWGIVTFREEDILYDDENSNAMDKQSITENMIFMFVQMWYGNMATPEWWNYLYFTKGLAYYLQFLVLDSLFDEWKVSSQFLYRVQYPAMKQDSLQASPGLRYGVNSTAEIISKYDKFNIIKSASLYRMLNEVITGYKSFRQGLEYFLTSFSYRTTEPQGLWNLIAAQVNLDNRERLSPNVYLKDILIDWEENPGFPLLSVTQEDEHIAIKQMGRFLYTGVDTSYSWYIPINYVLASNLTPFTNTTVSHYVTPNITLEIPIPRDGEEWIILNIQAAGYYRVDYTVFWPKIASALKAVNFSGIPEFNRAHLIDDVLELARANYLNYTFAFDMLNYLVEEESLNPWMTAFDGFNYILRRVGTATALGLKIKARIFTLFPKLYALVSWSTNNENDHIYDIKQMEILKRVCQLGYIECVKSANSQFTELKNSGRKPDTNLRQVVYCTGLLYGSDTANWDLLWTTYMNTDSSNERLNVLSALGCTENEALLQKTLALTLDSADIKPQDASVAFTSVYTSSRIGAKLALQFLLDNYKSIEKRFQGMNVLRNLVLGLAEHLWEPEQVTSFTGFLRSTTDLPEEILLASNEAIEITDVNNLWLHYHLNELNAYFEVGTVSEKEESVSSSTISSSTGVTDISIDELSPGSSIKFIAPLNLLATLAFGCYMIFA